MAPLASIRKVLSAVARSGPVIECPGCGAALTVATDACPDCGGDLLVECRACGTTLEADASRCPGCGDTDFVVFRLE